jgi:hypothetical protein
VSDHIRRENTPTKTDFDNLINDDVINTTILPVKTDPATACSSMTQQNYDTDAPPSRNVPLDAKINPATVEQIVPLIGLYRCLLDAIRTPLK